MRLGEKILQLRKGMGISQEQLADLMGVSRQAVSKWETNQSLPDVDKLVLLGQVFSVSTDELLGLDPKRPSEDTVRSCVETNFKKRLFTVGWVTALVGMVLLIVELLTLSLIQNDKMLAFGIAYTDSMAYAMEPPMNVVLALTGCLVLAGIGLAVYGLQGKSGSDKK